MASWITYKGLTIPDDFTPDDNAGEKLTDDLKLLIDTFETLDADNITTGTLAVTHGGTGTSTAFTQGSVVFAGASGVYSQDNANLFWSGANLGLGTNSFGTSAAKVLAIGNGTAPSTSPADSVQLWSADRGGTAGKASLLIRTEDGTSHVLGDRVGFATTTPADSVVTIAGSVSDASYSGRSASLRATSAGNNLLWGHSNPDYLCSLGARNGDGLAFVDFFCYQGPYNSSTPATWNKTYRASATNLPGQILYDVGGSWTFYTAPAGTIDAEITNFSARLVLTNGGQLEVGLGSGSAPTYAFIGDTNTGLWSPTSDVIAVSTGGAERLRIDGNGNVGLGITSVSNVRLHSVVSYTATSGSLLGINTTATLTPSGSTTASLIGSNVDATFAGSNNSSSVCYASRNSAIFNSSGTLTVLAGTYSDAYVTGSGTISDAYGVTNQIYLLSSSGNITRGSIYHARSALADTASGTIGRLFHFHSVAATVGTGGAAITNFAGLCIESQTVASNNTHVLLGTNTVPSGNWGVYVASTNSNYFAGKIGIANTSPSAQLTVSAGSSSIVGALVKGAASQSANLQEWQNSSGNVLIQFDANGGAVFNEQGSSSADFRIEGDTNANLLFADASADQIGIGTATPTSMLDVVGDIEIGSANAFYLGDPNTDGSWRFTRSGVNLIFEKRVSGSWVLKSTILG